MADGKHRAEGRTPRPRLPYIAMVEGYDRGVPFRTFYKRTSAAERDARQTGGELVDLRDLSRRRWVKGQWRNC